MTTSQHLCCIWSKKKRGPPWYGSEGGRGGAGGENLRIEDIGPSFQREKVLPHASHLLQLLCLLTTEKALVVPSASRRKHWEICWLFSSQQENLCPFTMRRSPCDRRPARNAKNKGFLH